MEEHMMNEEYKIGDTYYQMTLSYFQHLEEGGDEDDFLEEEKYCKCIVRYVTPEGWLIMEENDSSLISADGTFDASRFLGKEIKSVFPDFEGDDETEYIVPYYDGHPLYKADDFDEEKQDLA